MSIRFLSQQPKRCLAPRLPYLYRNSTYDSFGNATLEYINTYSGTSTTLIDHKKIENSFIDPTTQQVNYIAEARGTPIVSTVSRWSSIDETDTTKWIDKTITTNSGYDSAGNAHNQVSDTYVYKASTLTLASERQVNNISFDNLGNATSQHISNYTIDFQGTTIHYKCWSAV